MKYITLLLLLTSCATKGIIAPPPIPSTSVEALRVAYEAKKIEAQKVFDKETGWPSATDCDGLLWAGLAKAAGVATVRLEQAEFEPGHVYRRPKLPCWNTSGIHEAESTVSRDMVLGYLWGLWRSDDGDALKRLREYGESHDWVMGEPFPERLSDVLMNGNLIGLIGRMSCKMDKGCPWYKITGAVHSQETKDYVRHLSVLFALLNQEVGPLLGATTDDKKEIDWLYEQDPNDALMSAAYHMYEDGDFSESMRLLLSDSYSYPSYVRGSDSYPLVHWLFTAKLVLNNFD